MLGSGTHPSNGKQLVCDTACARQLSLEQERVVVVLHIGVVRHATVLDSAYKGTDTTIGLMRLVHVLENKLAIRQCLYGINHLYRKYFKISAG